MKEFFMKNQILVILFVVFCMFLLLGIVKSFGLYEGLVGSNGNSSAAVKIPVAKVYTF